MSDTKLDPTTLTSEERAIWDECALDLLRAGAASPCDCHDGALETANDMILARRALFATESEKPAQAEVCPNCKQVVDYENRHRWKHPNGPDTFDCKPAPVAAGPVMSEELTLVLFVAMHTVNHDKGWSPDYAEKVREAVAAVRAQAAAQPSPRPKLAKVRELIQKVRELFPLLVRLGCSDISRSFDDYANAALVELDAAEGAGS